MTNRSNLDTALERSRGSALRSAGATGHLVRGVLKVASVLVVFTLGVLLARCQSAHAAPLVTPAGVAHAQVSAPADASPGDASGARVASAASNPALAPCGPVDLTIIQDRTLSMAGPIRAIRDELPRILDDLERASGRDYQASLVTFDDAVQVVVPLQPGNRAAMDQAIRGLGAAGGGRPPEAWDEAISTAAQSLPAAGRRQQGDFGAAWRPEATRIIVLVVDSQPGGFADTWVPGQSGEAARAAARAAAERGIRINPVFVPSQATPTDRAAIRQVLAEVAEITGGRLLETARDGKGAGRAISDILGGCGTAAAVLPEPVGPDPAAPGLSEADALPAPPETPEERIDMLTRVKEETLQNLATIAPWLVTPVVVLLFFLLLYVMLSSLVARNWPMHVINRGHAVLVSWTEGLARGLRQLDAWLVKQIEAGVTGFSAWPVPWKKPGEIRQPVETGAYPVYELTGWIWPALKNGIMLVADLVYAALGATRVLGLPLLRGMESTVIFGLTWDAIAFAAAMVLSISTFVETALSLRGAASDSARPFGNADPELRARLEKAMWVASGISAVGLILFALYRADLEVMGEDGVLLVAAPYLMVPIFALSTAGAVALTAWSIPVGMVAVVVYVLMTARAGMGVVLRFVAYLATKGLNRWDQFIIAILDWICKPFTHAWNVMLAGRKLLGRELPRINYCERPRLGVRLDSDLFDASEPPAPPQPRCYCTPGPEAGAQAPARLVRGRQRRAA